MNWKQMIAEFISSLNQMVVEGEEKLPRHLFRSSDEIVDKEIDRINRFKQSLNERKGTPLKMESSIRFIHIQEDNNYASVDVFVRSSFYYEQMKSMMGQEFHQYYQVDCRRDGEKWTIEKWVPLETPSSFLEVIPGDSRSESRQLVFENEMNLFRPTRAYDRSKAVRYAETWWNGHNPRYLLFADDCTNFISQCIHAGGLPMEMTGRRDRGWWYRGTGPQSASWSFSWTVANSLYWYLRNGRNIPTQMVSSPEELSLGDIICYDFDGDGRWQHNTIVCGFDRMGMPLVNAHTNNSRMRYWDYKDSYAWTEQTKYTFFHINA